MAQQSQQSTYRWSYPSELWLPFLFSSSLALVILPHSSLFRYVSSRLLISAVPCRHDSPNTPFLCFPSDCCPLRQSLAVGISSLQPHKTPYLHLPINIHPNSFLYRQWNELGLIKQKFLEHLAGRCTNNSCTNKQRSRERKIACTSQIRRTQVELEASLVSAGINLR